MWKWELFCLGNLWSEIEIFKSTHLFCIHYTLYISIHWKYSIHFTFSIHCIFSFICTHSCTYHNTLLWLCMHSTLYILCIFYTLARFINVFIKRYMSFIVRALYIFIHYRSIHCTMYKIHTKSTSLETYFIINTPLPIHLLMSDCFFLSIFLGGLNVDSKTFWIWDCMAFFKKRSHHFYNFFIFFCTKIKFLWFCFISKFIKRATFYNLLNLFKIVIKLLSIYKV